MLVTPIYHFTYSLYRFPKNFCNTEKENFLKNQHQCGDYFLYYQDFYIRYYDIFRTNQMLVTLKC